MSRSLAIYFLLIAHLFSSSASFLKSTQPALEESSAGLSPLHFSRGSRVTSLDTNITTLAALTGYVTQATYRDAACQNPILALVVALNTCYRTGLSEYNYNTATGTSVTFATYTDAKCSLGEDKSVLSYTDSVCSGYKATFVTASSKVSTSVQTASLR